MNHETFKGPVNIGNPEEYTMIELAEKIIKMTNSRSKLTFETLPTDDPMQRRPDILLAGQVLGWNPEISVEEGLEKTIKYFKSLL